MSNTADKSYETFGFLESTPKRSTPFTRVMDAIRELTAATEKHGALIPAAFLEQILGVSKQRVHQILNEDKLVVLTFMGKNYVTEDSLVSYVKTINTDDKRVNLPKGRVETFKRAMAYSKEIVKE